jgi:hypothetical protein
MAYLGRYFLLSVEGFFLVLRTLSWQGDGATISKPQSKVRISQIWQAFTTRFYGEPHLYLCCVYKTALIANLFAADTLNPCRGSGKWCRVAMTIWFIIQYRRDAMLDYLGLIPWYIQISTLCLFK